MNIIVKLIKDYVLFFLKKAWYYKQLEQKKEELKDIRTEGKEITDDYNKKVTNFDDALAKYKRDGDGE